MAHAAEGTSVHRDSTAKILSASSRVMLSSWMLAQVVVYVYKLHKTKKPSVTGTAAFARRQRQYREDLISLCKGHAAQLYVGTGGDVATAVALQVGD